MSRTRLIILLGAAAYVVTLQWAYRHVMVPTYAYMGMGYRPQETTALLVQYGLALLPAIWMPREILKPSQFQNWTLYLTVIVPSCIVPYHATELAARDVHVFLVIVIACFAGLCGVSFLPRLRMPRVHISIAMFGWILAGCSLLVYGWLISQLGLPSLFLPINQVYELRLELRETHLPALLGYLIFWQGLVVNPMITSLGVMRRSMLLVFLGILLQIELYTITSLKVFLLATFFQCGVCLFFVVRRRHRGAAFILGMVGVVLGALIWHQIDGEAFGPLLTLERWIFNSGQLSGYYLEFFSRHAHAGLQYTSVPVLRWMFPGPYDLPIGQVIGREYFIRAADGVYTNATAHFWADGYASFGGVGVLSATVVAAVMLWLSDSVCRAGNRQFGLMAFALVTTSLSGQSAFTSILTGGFVPYLILMLCTPRRFGATRNVGFKRLFFTREKNRSSDLSSPSA